MTGHRERIPILPRDKQRWDGWPHAGSRLVSPMPEVTWWFCLARLALPGTRVAGRAASVSRGMARGGSLARHPAPDFEPGLCTFLGRAATLSLEEAADGSGMYQSPVPLLSDGGVSRENPCSQAGRCSHLLEARRTRGAIAARVLATGTRTLVRKLPQLPFSPTSPTRWQRSWVLDEDRLQPHWWLGWFPLEKREETTGPRRWS